MSCGVNCELCISGCLSAEEEQPRVQGGKEVTDIEETLPMGVFNYEPMFQTHATTTRSTQWRPVFAAGDAAGAVKVLKLVESGETATQQGTEHSVVQVKGAQLMKLAHEAVVDIQHFFRTEQLEGWRRILDDPESSDNDKFVALNLLRNACVAAKKVLPACQDTGTAIVFAKKGDHVWMEPGVNDEEALSRGIFEAYKQHNLRYSQVAPLSMFKEANTKCNLPAQFDILSAPGNSYDFLFIAKGGGSANKSFLFQETKALLNEKKLLEFLDAKLRLFGTSACPPYHVAVVIGGTSAEATMKSVKLASCRYYDNLPTTGNNSGRAFRDLDWEQRVYTLCNSLGIGSQFGGKYFAHQARVIRLPRHGASCPVGIGLSCSADRQILGRISPEGVFLEQLDYNPNRFLPTTIPKNLGGEAVPVDLNQPMDAIRALLSKFPVKTRLSLTGPVVVARDMAHAKIKDRLDAGEPLPDYIKNHIIYYAGPAKTPEGYASGSFGPTTAGRMDPYKDIFMSHGGGYISLAKGNRSTQVKDACKKHGGFYLGSIGGPAAILATESIKKVEVLEFEDLGMEAVFKIMVEDFPAFIVIDDKGNDFFDGLL